MSDHATPPPSGGITRRDLLTWTTLLGAGGVLGGIARLVNHDTPAPSAPAVEESEIIRGEPRPLPAQAVTRGPEAHFFNHYHLSPWDASQRYLLSHAATVAGREPTADDWATIGLIDRADGDRWLPLDETNAWNWQQGAILQWVPPADRWIIYNQRDGDRAVSVLRDIESGETRRLPLPVAALSHNGRSALSLNYARMRPGYRYVGLPDPCAGQLASDEDGLFWMDLATGEHRLICSLAEAAQLDPTPEMAEAEHYFSNVMFNPGDTRLVLYHRWRTGPDRWQTRVLTLAPDGSDLHVLIEPGFASHWDWYDDRHLLAWAEWGNTQRFFLFEDGSQADPRIIGDRLLYNAGHCSFSPDRRWLLTDTYPDFFDGRQYLILYHLASGRRLDIGRFRVSPDARGPYRCDLHPRWNRDGTQVCIDSTHEGQRQMYVVDVREIIREFEGEA
jgi:hypothetical protein